MNEKRVDLSILLKKVPKITRPIERLRLRMNRKMKRKKEHTDGEIDLQSERGENGKAQVEREKEIFFSSALQNCNLIVLIASHIIINTKV